MPIPVQVDVREATFHDLTVSIDEKDLRWIVKRTYSRALPSLHVHASLRGLEAREGRCGGVLRVQDHAPRPIRCHVHGAPSVLFGGA